MHLFRVIAGVTALATGVAAYPFGSGSCSVDYGTFKSGMMSAMSRAGRESSDGGWAVLGASGTYKPAETYALEMTNNSPTAGKLRGYLVYAETAPTDRGPGGNRVGLLQSDSGQFDKLPTECRSPATNTHKTRLNTDSIDLTWTAPLAGTGTVIFKSVAYDGTFYTPAEVTLEEFKEPAMEAPRICCRAMTVPCLACTQGLDEEEYCNAIDYAGQAGPGCNRHFDCKTKELHNGPKMEFCNQPNTSAAKPTQPPGGPGRKKKGSQDRKGKKGGKKKKKGGRKKGKKGM